MNASGKNAYEQGTQKIIPAVLLYAFHEGKVLMIHRNRKENDFHEGKWNGLGGKMELFETPAQCAVREFQEEASCNTLAAQWIWSGQLLFPNFKPKKNEDWWVTIFRTELTAEQVQEIKRETPEGTLHWIESNHILNLNLWEGDQIFIPSVLNKIPFEGTFFYQDSKLDHFIFNPIIN